MFGIEGVAGWKERVCIKHMRAHALAYFIL